MPIIIPPVAPLLPTVVAVAPGRFVETFAAWDKHYGAPDFPLLQRLGSVGDGVVTTFKGVASSVSSAAGSTAHRALAALPDAGAVTRYAYQRQGKAALGLAALAALGLAYKYRQPLKRTLKRSLGFGTPQHAQQSAAAREAKTPGGMPPPTPPANRPVTPARTATPSRARTPALSNTDVKPTSPVKDKARPPRQRRSGPPTKRPSTKKKSRSSTARRRL